MSTSRRPVAMPSAAYLRCAHSASAACESEGTANSFHFRWAMSAWTSVGADLFTGDVPPFRPAGRASPPRSPAARTPSWPTIHSCHLKAAAVAPVGLGHAVAVPQVAHRHGEPAPGQQSVGGVLRRIPRHVAADELAVADSGGCCGLKPSPSPSVLEETAAVRQPCANCLRRRRRIPRRPGRPIPSPGVPDPGSRR